MTEMNKILASLDTLLRNGNFTDEAVNGLQVDAGIHKVAKVAFAVDAGLSVIEEAIRQNAQLLIVHHGILWKGQTSTITGAFGEKLRRLFAGGCSLYASHLPLDANEEVGNNYELSRFLEMVNITPFFEYKGEFIGAGGEFKRHTSLTDITNKLSELSKVGRPLVLPFGKQLISRAAIITGSGSIGISKAAEQGFDLLISGEPKQAAYHQAKELKINCIFAGHYATETFGVKALLKHLSKEYQIDTFFIDEETGI